MEQIDLMYMPIPTHANSNTQCVALRVFVCVNLICKYIYDVYIGCAHTYIYVIYGTMYVIYIQNLSELSLFIKHNNIVPHRTFWATDQLPNHDMKN